MPPTFKKNTWGYLTDACKKAFFHVIEQWKLTRHDLEEIKQIIELGSSIQTGSEEPTPLPRSYKSVSIAP